MTALPILIAVTWTWHMPVLSALLTFADRVVYPHYAEVPRLGNMTALQDQAAAGVLMWVPGSLIYLLPLFTIALRLMYGEARRERSTAIAARALQ